MPAPEKDPTWRAWVDGPPPLNQPPFLLLRLPALSLPSLVLITVHEGEGREEGGGGNPCRAPLLLPRLAASSLQQSLLSPLLPRLFLFLISPVFPPSRPRPRSWSVGWFHYPLRAMHCRSFTAGLPTQFLHVSLSLVCLSVCHASLSPLFISW